MTPKLLASKIRKLPDRGPTTAAFERALMARRIWSNENVWYLSQKEHWLGWLSEYHGPGYYGRKTTHQSAEYAYNHIVCPPMVLWLGEASGVPKSKVAAAKRAAMSVARHLPAKCAAIRKVIPWEMIEIHLNKHRQRNVTALRR